MGFSPDPLCFIGPPGAGKTALLKYAKQTLITKNWLCGYSEASPDTSSAIEDFLNDARRSLPAGKIAEKFLSRITEVSISGPGVGAGIKLGEASNRTAYSRLVDLFTAIGDLAKRSGVGVALLIDEAQALPAGDLRLLLRCIRSVDNYPVSIIIAGLPALVWDIVESDSGRATGEKFRIFLVPELTPGESLQALYMPIDDADGAIRETQLRRMVHFTEGHPLTLRILGAAAWEAADNTILDDRPLAIEESHVSEAIQETTRQLWLAYYEPMWRKSSAEERELIISIAAKQAPRGNDWLSASEDRAWFLEGNDLLSWLWHAANGDTISSLANRGVISMIHPDEFTIPGFGRFVQHYK